MTADHRYCVICRYGVGAYLNILPGSEWTAIMLTYGFPLAIIVCRAEASAMLDFFRCCKRKMCHSNA
ncbi:hypothetical protein OIU84_028759 [Salix udensis]|uniref:Uncharacterized protein n=1 Tax=Salix udensis TaxID=889485 RepID=A0AAD6KFA4_9ROSI|nr:hypothetical protein OIU84_028759 [Salix udensis]